MTYTLHPAQKDFRRLVDGMMAPKPRLVPVPMPLAYEAGCRAGRLDWRIGSYNPYPRAGGILNPYDREFARGYSDGWR